MKFASWTYNFHLVNIVLNSNIMKQSYKVTQTKELIDKGHLSKLQIKIGDISGGFIMHFQFGY